MLSDLKQKVTSTLKRGDKVRADRLSGRRITLSRFHRASGEQGFTLIELLVVITIIVVLLALPLVTLELWGFIAPGLYKEERRYAVPFILFAALAFMAEGLAPREGCRRR